MGKLVWPAGYAMCLSLLETPSLLSLLLPKDSPRPSLFLEVGAGCGLAALAAAGAIHAASSSARPVDRVVATEMTEEGVQLLEANNALCGGLIDEVCRLDILEDADGISRLISSIQMRDLREIAHLGDAPASCASPASVLVCACDMSYDLRLVRALGAATRRLDRQLEGLRGASSSGEASLGVLVRLVLARSQNFDHLDEASLNALSEEGLQLERRYCRMTPAGVLAPYTGGSTGEDESVIFVFKVKRGGGRDSIPKVPEITQRENFNSNSN